MFSTSSLGNSQSRIALDAGDQRNQNSIVAEPSQVLRVVFGDQLDVIGIMTMTYVYIYVQPWHENKHTKVECNPIMTAIYHHVPKWNFTRMELHPGTCMASAYLLGSKPSFKPIATESLGSTIDLENMGPTDLCRQYYPIPLGYSIISPNWW